MTIYVQKTQARAELDAPLTSGSVGREVEFRFSDDWAGLTKTAVFETIDYRESSPVPDSGTAAIPKDVLAFPGYRLRIGVVGKSTDGAIVIPTVYADCGAIETGASTAPMGPPPTPGQYEQLQAQIDALREEFKSVELDSSLSQPGQAADAKAVGDAFKGTFDLFNTALEGKQPKGNYVKKVNGQTPDAEGNVSVSVPSTEGLATETYVQNYVEQYISEALGGDY